MLDQNEKGIRLIIMNDEKTRGGARPGSGRKPLPAGEAMLPVVVNMKPAQKEKMQRLGGAAWVRARIDKAKEPELKE